MRKTKSCSQQAAVYDDDEVDIVAFQLSGS